MSNQIADRTYKELRFPPIVHNVKDANGRCGHNMIPPYCAYCNPIVLKRAKRKKADKRNTTSRFILVLVDCEDGEVLDRFYDDQTTEAKAARDEVNEACGTGTCRINIIENPKHPDYEPPPKEVEGNVEDADETLQQ